MANIPNVVIDIGNTRAKSAEFYSQEPENIQTWDDIEDIRLSIPREANLIVSSVATPREKLQSLFCNFRPLIFDRKTPIPIGLDYGTPETLGLDRIAAAIGAYMEFERACLIIDMGTCITYDIIDDHGNFQGGAIAPGLSMRLKSMHIGTTNLPDLTGRSRDETVFPAKSTSSSMLTGTKIGIAHEINGFISQAQAEFANINVILTGGDGPLFESFVKAPIFVRPNLVLSGLNRILTYNEAE